MLPMATVQRDFDTGTALLGLYKDLPYVRKLGYSVGEMAGRILVRVVIDADCGDDEFYDNAMEAVRKAGEYEDMMPASMRGEYEVVPMVTSPYEGALDHFRAITSVIDR